MNDTTMANFFWWHSAHDNSNEEIMQWTASNCYHCALSKSSKYHFKHLHYSVLHMSTHIALPFKWLSSNCYMRAPAVFSSRRKVGKKENKNYFKCHHRCQHSVQYTELWCQLVTQYKFLFHLGHVVEWPVRFTLLFTHHNNHQHRHHVTYSSA